jgi:hypothetical protein
MAQDKSCQMKPTDENFWVHTQLLITEMREANDAGDHDRSIACEVHFLQHIQDFQRWKLFGAL